MVSESSPLGGDREKILQGARGLLRTYYHLIKYESDFDIAQTSRLLPQDVTWEEFADFIGGSQLIRDSEVSPRFTYGELRLTRLNFWSRFFLKRWRYEEGLPQYGAFFNEFYGHILFVFAVFSLILSALQVELAAESLVDDKWSGLWYTSRYASIICLVLLILLAFNLAMVLIAMLADEWIYAIRQVRFKRPSMD